LGGLRFGRLFIFFPPASVPFGVVVERSVVERRIEAKRKRRSEAHEERRRGGAAAGRACCEALQTVRRGAASCRRKEKSSPPTCIFRLATSSALEKCNSSDCKEGVVEERPRRKKRRRRRAEERAIAFLTGGPRDGVETTSILVVKICRQKLQLQDSCGGALRHEARRGAAAARLRREARLTFTRAFRRSRQKVRGKGLSTKLRPPQLPCTTRSRRSEGGGTGS